MGRPLRVSLGGLVYHVLNRANARMQLFGKDADYEAFERVLAEARAREDMRILAYCVMPNHWHLVLWPRRDGDLSRFVGWLTLTHTQRWHAYRKSSGTGHAYQGRFRSSVVQSDGHLLTVCRYVERNPLRARLVARAEEWPWSSLHRRTRDGAESKALLARWPVELPPDWTRYVNRPEMLAELGEVRQCVRKGRPFGAKAWVARAVRRFGLEPTTRDRGRPAR